VIHSPLSVDRSSKESSGEFASYVDLRVWHASIDLAEMVYELCKTFPKEELFALTLQLKKSAVSISSNIAEGCARNGSKEFIQFLGIASGSLAELRTQIIIAKRVKLCTDEAASSLEEKIIVVSKMLAGLRRSIRTIQNPPSTENEQRTTENT